MHAPRRWIDGAVRASAVQQWRGLAADAESMPLRQLRGLRAEAAALRDDLDRFTAAATRRIEGAAQVADPPDLPAGTDWTWQPLAEPRAAGGLAGADSGARLGAAISVWHDCPDRAVIARLTRSAGRNGTGGEITLETLAASAGYLSLSVDLPETAKDGLTRGHILRLDMALAAERPVGAYLRLNIEHGPDTETALQQIGHVEPGPSRTIAAEFDLHYVEMDADRLRKLWLDVIFEAPGPNAIRVSELVFSRRRRAEV